MSNRDHRARSAGHAARSPAQIPARGWFAIGKRVVAQIGKDNVSLVAAGVAFYVMLALPSTLAAIVSIYGLATDPDQVAQQLSALSNSLPGDSGAVVRDQLGHVASQGQAALSFSALVALGLAIFTARSAIVALMTAMNIAYDEHEQRGFLSLQVRALLLTLAGIMVAVVALAAVIVAPALLGALGPGIALLDLVNWLRWPIIALAVIVFLALLYRFGPSREAAEWRWITPGAVIATLVWLVGSALFSIYVANFASYNETYGSLGGLVILLMWFWLSSFVVMVGAEINAEAEHETAEDSTTGRERPMGERGAYHADHVVSG